MHGQPRAGRHRIAGYVGDATYTELLAFGCNTSRALEMALDEWVRLRCGVTPTDRPSIWEE